MRTRGRRSGQRSGGPVLPASVLLVMLGTYLVGTAYLYGILFALGGLP